MSWLVPLRSLPRPAQISLSLLPTVAVLGLRDFLPAVFKITPAALHYPVVFLAAWLGGFVPGILSTLFCSAYSLMVLRPHLIEKPLSDLPSLVRSVMFFLTCLIFLILVSGLRRALLKAENAVRIRDEFLAVASHELRTPITSLMLRTQLQQRNLKRQPETALALDQAEKYLHDDLVNLSQLEQLVSVMLEVTHIDDLESHLTKEKIDLREVLESAIAAKSEVAKRLGVAIDFRRGEQPIVGQWDAARLQQMFVNLLTNALQFGQKSPILIELKQAKLAALIRIIDRGPGIAKADRRRVLRRFERVVDANEVSGFGLGLFLSKQIAKAHGGDLRLISAPQRGTTVQIRLPLAVVRARPPRLESAGQ